MNIVEKLSFDFSYSVYTKEDLSVSHDIGNLLKRKDEVFSYFSNIRKSEVYDTDTFADYFYLLKMKELTSYKDIIKKEFIDEVDECYDRFDSLLKRYDIGKLIRYFNESTEELLVFFLYDLRPFFSFIRKYQGGIKQSVYEFIEDSKWYLIMDYFGDVVAHYNVEENVRRYVSKVNNDELIKVHIGRFENFLVNVNKTKHSEEFGLLASSIVEIGIEITKILDEDNYLDHAHILDVALRIGALFEIGKVMKLRAFSKKRGEINNLYLEKHGKSFKTDGISLDPFIKLIESDENPVGILLSLILSKEEDRVINGYESLCNGYQPSIVDFVTTVGVETNDFFTPGKIGNIEVYNKFYIDLIYMILNNEKGYKNFTSGVVEVSRYLSENGYVEYDLFGQDLLDSILQLARLNKGEDQETTHNINILAISTLLCGLIEWCMRSWIVNSLSDDMYIEPKYYTLGSMLSHEAIHELLGVNGSRVLQYILSHDQDSIVGMNLRNELAHGNIRSSQISLGVPNLLMFILLMVFSSKFVRVKFGSQFDTSE